MRVDTYLWRTGKPSRRRSLVRVLNPGGLVWESGDTYASLDAALAEEDRAVTAELATY